MVSSALDTECAMAGTVVNIDSAGILESLSQLASTPGAPAGAIVQALTSIRFNQANRKGTAEETNKARETNGKETRKRSQVTDQTVWPCRECSKSFSNNSNLKRHVRTAHVKRQRLVETNLYECDDCDSAYASQAALDAHMDTHASTSKSPKHKCDFCTRERTSIYVHYCSYHKIEYPEQVMFENGNVLVISDIDTDRGRAGWFLKEKEKMKSYKDVTCRLCEVEMSFDNAEYLAAHYTMYHMVDPSMLENIKHVFRAEKGAHLIDLPTSHTPKRRQTDISAVKKKVPIQVDEKKTQNEKTKLKTPLESEVRAVFNCKECNITFDTEVLLDKHNIEKHGPKTTAKKPECTLCNKEVIQIYKHYGNVHNIEYPEQMLFENGNVLVLTDIDTNKGTAPWFLSEREKAVDKYTLSTCRLCEIEYDNTGLLEMHYLSEHKVRPEALERLGNLRCIFRAEKGAHLVDLPASKAKKQHKVTTQQNTAPPMDKKESKCNEAVKADQSGQGSAGLVMYQCAECSVAATTCDASIEHAQLHHLPDYRPIPQTCDICNFTFEIQCFADHVLHHLSRNEYKIVKFHPSKLLDEWSEMFEGLSESHANRIKASSVYQYTRRVKMNPDTSPGIPVYRCGKCELYVRPKDVEGHCYGKTACVDNQAPGHFCPDCEIYFYTSVGLTEHEKHHKQYGADYFRRVTFNCREDEVIYRALQELQSAKADETPVTPGRNKSSIKVIEDVVVYQFCGECKKSIVNSEYEAHAAMHKVREPLEHNPSPDIDVTQEQICSNLNKEHNHSDPQHNAMGTEGTVEGTVESWNSDNDSCNSLLVATYAVEVDIHEQNLENAPNYQAVNATNQEHVIDAIEVEMNELFFSPKAQDAPPKEVFSETMTNDLKRDIEHLGFTEFGVDMNQWAYIPDDLTSNKFLELDNDTMENSNFSSYCSDDKDAIARNSQDTSTGYSNVSPSGNNCETLDIFNTTTETREDIDKINNNTGPVNTTKTSSDIFETSGETHGGNVPNTSGYEVIAQNDLESNARPSSRDILFRILSDGAALRKK